MRIRASRPRIFASLVAALILYACGGAQTATRQREQQTAGPVYVVRHAEKVLDAGDDPDLTDAGRRRASALARVLDDVDLRSIVVTQLRRTQQTANPTARGAGLDLTVVPIRDDLAEHVRAVAEAARSAGGPVLIVGHSNTIPAIIEGLGAPRPLPIEDSDYDNLFEVSLSDGSVVRHSLPAE